MKQPAAFPMFSGLRISVWRDDAGAWRLGPQHDHASPRLRDVLAAAVSRDWGAPAVTAWSLLARVDVGVADQVHALLEEAGDDLVDGQSLQPLLVRAALASPAAVARWFPVRTAVAPATLRLCGEPGLHAALQALAGSSTAHRLAAAFALQELRDAGQAVPTAPVRAALAREHDDDVADALRDVLPAVAT